MQGAKTDRTKVLYISGTARCGSTLLDRALGEIPGFLSAGELNLLWLRGLINQEPCSCRAPVQECGFWKGVFAEAYGGFGAIDPHQMAARAGWTPAVLGRLYAAIGHVGQCRVIVDSSKLPRYALALGAVPGIELYVVHLVRDSRAVAHSLLRRKVRFEAAGEKVYMGAQAQSPIRCAWRWMRVNTRSEVLGRRGLPYLRVRYEDFTAQPLETLQHIASFVGEQLEYLPLTGGRTIVLSGNHAASGNPMRFDTGPTEIVADEAWRRQQPVAQRCAVTALTWPLLLRYGYPVSPARAAQSAVPAA